MSKNGELLYCNDIGIQQELECTNHSEEWGLFVHPSKFILKVVLLNNGNIHPSIPIAHSVHMKEIYVTMDLLLKAVSYLN